MSDWRYIPGFGEDYEVSREGVVRSWRCGNNRRRTKPRILSQYIRHGGRPSCRKRYVRLTDSNGKAHDVPMLRLMSDVWLGGCPEGMVPYHKNGDLADHNINNIGFITPQALGKMCGAKARRKPVLRINKSGEVVAMYPSAREAARANYICRQSVHDRCNGKVQKPFELDGHTYRYDD